MDVLIITGSPLRLNSSANLCHRAYIFGLIENGNTVDIIEMSEKDLNIDDTITVPDFRNVYEYGSSFYSKLGAKKSSTIVISRTDSEENLKFNINFKSKLKRFVRTKLYGIYGMDIVWYYKVKFGYKQNANYDLVVSLAYPLVSHKVAEFLLKKRIVAKKWIQIWEDPWSLAPGNNYRNPKSLREERRILSKADEIIYVSPITLSYQKEEFPESSDKMRWLPLPSYFSENDNNIDFSELKFGYFGDYTSDVRNLKPFYNVVNDFKLNTVICGKSDLNLVSNDSITIRPRIPIGELKEYEEKTNVLVLLCNLGGGQIPGKIYQCSATNKLILFILDGSDDEKRIITEYFSQFNRFVFCDNNEDSIKDAINSIPKYLKSDCYTKPLDLFSPKNIARCIVENTDLDYCT